MCTVLMMKTFKSFSGAKLDLVQWTRWLTYRGRDKYRIIIYDGVERVYDCEGPIDVINYLSSIRGEALVAIFGRATPETEEDVEKPLKQPLTITKDGQKFVALHHGLYPGAGKDEYDSYKLVERLLETQLKGEEELRYNSSFVLMIADASALPGHMTVYVGQLPCSMVADDSYLVVGTIPDVSNHHFSYCKLSFSFTGKKWNLKFTPLDPRGLETGYTSKYISYDSVLMPRYVVCKAMSLFSGGMDSLIATDHFLNSCKMLGTHIDTLYLLYYNYGQFAAKEELEATHRCAEYLSKLHDIKVEVLEKELSFLESNLTSKSLNREVAHTEAEHDVNYVPMRNLIMISHAAALCEQLGVHFLVVGFNLSEGMVYSDNSPVFYYNIAGALQVAGKKGYRLNLVAPLLNMTKTEAVAYALTRKLELSRSFSCYYPQNGKPCNECGSCILRNKAIERAKKIIEQRKAVEAQQKALDEMVQNVANDVSSLTDS